MSTPVTQVPPTAQSAQSLEPVPRAPLSRSARIRVALVWTALVSLAALVIVAVSLWWRSRAAHSVTDDAFVEAHVVNVAPEMVSGRIVKLLVDEDDRVERGQLLAVIDPVPYRDKVNLAASRRETARRELARQEADLARLRREVPIQVEIARRSLASAAADRARAEASLELTTDDCEKAIDEARAGRKAAQADHARIANLERTGSSTRHELDQFVRARDAAQAHLELAEAKLAKAVAGRTQVEVAQRTLEAARTAAEKAARSVDLSETGYDQIKVVELQVEVKKEAVREAERALESAEHDLAYTRVLAPFPGVVVRRYRHLGDFASAGVAVLSMYNPELVYVTANLEETRLPGVAPGCDVRLDVDAVPGPFRGRVIWVSRSTGAQFALMPRNVVSGEFTKVVQRVPVRIQIEADDPRRDRLRAGLSVRVSVRHGKGDPAWAARAAREMADIEGRFNRPVTATGIEDSAAVLAVEAAP